MANLSKCWKSISKHKMCGKLFCIDVNLKTLTRALTNVNRISECTGYKHPQHKEVKKEKEELVLSCALYSLLGYLGPCVVRGTHHSHTYLVHYSDDIHGLGSKDAKDVHSGCIYINPVDGSQRMLSHIHNPIVNTPSQNPMIYKG
jgi:hypothetical protein